MEKREIKVERKKEMNPLSKKVIKTVKKKKQSEQSKRDIRL